jgi:hypothetical protein
MRCFCATGLIGLIGAFAVLTACGDYQQRDTNSPAATPTADPSIIDINRLLATAGLPTVDPHLTDADRRRLQNEWNAAQGWPTLDPSISDADYTATVDARIATVEGDTTALPVPTPKPPGCGPVDGPDGRNAIVSRYGGVLTDCARYADKWVITTYGTDNSPGIIGVLECPEGDDPCERGDDPASDVEWSLFTLPGAPNGSFVKITASGSNPGESIAGALTLNFGCGFSLRTYEIRCHGTWRDFVTPSGG